MSQVLFLFVTHLGNTPLIRIDSLSNALGVEVLVSTVGSAFLVNHLLNHPFKG